MGADGYDAGSIFVTLKAQLDEFNAGINSAKKTLDGLGTSGEVVFQELNTGTVVFTEIEDRSAKTAQAFDRLNTGAERLGLGVEQAVRFFQALNQQTDRLNSSMGKVGQTVPAVNQGTQQLEARANTGAAAFGRYTNRLIGVQIAMLSLSQNASGPMREAFVSISNGVTTATSAMQLFGNKISLAGGGLLALGVAIETYIFRAWENAIKATDAGTEAMEKTRKATDALRTSISDANLVIGIFGGTLSDKLNAKLALTESAFASNQKRIREISDELRALNGETGFLSPDQSAKVEALNQERTNLNRQQDDIRRTAAFDKANASTAQLLQSTKDLRLEYENVEIKGKSALAFGIAEPAQVATTNTNEARAVFEKLLDDNVKILDAANAYNVTLEQRTELLKKLHSPAEIKLAADDVKAKKAIEDATKATADLAKTFSTAVGDGLRDAILNAKKPMEALAGIGQNLFGNMIDQTVKRLETGLASAFTSITGVAGEGVGLALTGILGAAGGILSKLGSKGKDAFNPVQSVVTSSQAVRGIVAGPSSVAIATVSDDLQRAVAPVVARLDSAIGWLSKIESNTRGGRAGGGSSNVAVATR